MFRILISIPFASFASRGLLFVALTTMAAGLFTIGGDSLAQSGRRKTDPARQSPVPTPTVTTAGPEGESESQPMRGSKTNQAVAATFVVLEDENVFLDLSFSSQRDLIGASFFERLRRSPIVSVERGGKGSRSEARDRAKKERDAYVVLLQLEEDRSITRQRPNDRLGSADPSNLAIRLDVYAPGTGNVKYTDVVLQRPYRQTATIGGVRLPVPVSRPERYPGEYQLAQAARDAADRLLSRFDIPRPPEN